MQRMWTKVFVIGCCLSSLGGALPAEEKPAAVIRPIGKHEWQTDYATAYRLAKKERKQLLMWFYDERDQIAAAEFERDVLAAAELEKKLAEFIRVRLPMTALAPAGKSAIMTPEDSSSSGMSLADMTKPATSKSPATPVAPAEGAATEGVVQVAAAVPDVPRKLLDSDAFVHMRKQPGLCIVDLVDSKDPFHGRVVTVSPADELRHSAASLKVMLELPRGSLSQRTLIYVLRTHPEVPASVWGKTDTFILDQARHHSQLMANYESVGHHDWGYRAGVIGQHYGYSPMEVASVGGGVSILQAAHSAVATWRSSGVHWGMMITPSSHFGYDMIQGASGNWYATGIIIP